MTSEPSNPTAASQPLRWLGYAAPLTGIFCAFFTGHIFSALLRGHAWGPAGRPGWVAHGDALGFAIGLGLSLIALGASLFTTWWVARVAAMARQRYRSWYLWSVILGLPIGLMYGRLTIWLIHTQGMPSVALHVVMLGLVATTMTSGMIGYYRMESLARTQRELLIQAQLAPHFLFNSLSTLKGQIADEPLEAQATADRLARLFRELMDLSGQSAIPLARELAFVEAFLGLEKARLGDRLQVHIQVPEELEDFPVPPLSLQVLVENALRHAIIPSVEGGLLTIRAYRVCSTILQLVVGDPGTGESPTPGSGRGLQVLRARLARPSDLAFEKLPEGHQATLLLRKA